MTEGASGSDSAGFGGSAAAPSEGMQGGAPLSDAAGGAGPGSVGAGAGGTSGSPPGGEPQGTPPSIQASALNLSFVDTDVGVSSEASAWTVSNSGGTTSGPLQLTVINPEEFLVTGRCDELGAGGACTLQIQFNPRDSGVRTGRIDITGAAGTVASVALAGLGVYRVTLNFEGDGAGRVTSDAGPDCTDTCTIFRAASALELEVHTQNGSSSFFSGWTAGPCSGLVRQCSISVDDHVTIGVRFSAMTQNLMFVSSRGYPSTLGSLEAYDAECNALATSAGINTSAGDGFIAGMNDSTRTLRQRLGSARGWVRLDGRPIGDRLEDLFRTPLPTVYFPVAFTELGTTARNVVWAASGEADATACDDWTDDSDQFVTLGAPHSGPGWFATWGEDCSSADIPIYCVGNTRTAALPTPPAVQGKRIWTTDTRYIPGSMTPDAKCIAERPPGVSRAVALVAYVDRAASELIDPNATYVRSDGQLVGTGKQVIDLQMASGPWMPANPSAISSDLTSSTPIWSGGGGFDLERPGTPETTCDNWQNPNGTSTFGLWGFSDLLAWSYLGSSCSQFAHLYCVEP